MNKRHFNWRTAVGALLLSGIAGAQVPAEEGKVNFELAAQPMGDALNSFAEQSGFRIVFYARAARGRMAPEMAGSYTATEALRILLAGSELRYRFVDGKTVEIYGPDRGAQRTEAGGTDFTDGVSLETRLAQVETPPPSQGEGPGKERENGIEEVIVTARKVSERLQDVPVSVTAISGETLNSLGAVDLKDVLRSVPGLSFTGVERGESKYTIRGVNTTTTSPTVGIFLDDISLVTQLSSAGTGAFDAVLFDIERLEVLKGPQGTLYGGSAMGGAIKYISARPNLSNQTLSVAAGTSSTAHGDLSYNAEGVLNLPVIRDVLAIRGGVSYRHEGGYVDNIAGLDIENASYSATPLPTYTPLVRPSLATQSKDDYNSGATQVGRLSLLWQPDPSWTIRPAATYQDIKTENPPYFFTNQQALVSSYRFIKQPTHDVAAIYSLDVNKELSGVQLTSLTAYFDRNVTWDRDYSFFVGGLADFLYPFNSMVQYTIDTKVFSQELRIASRAGAESRLKWLGGLYYAKQDEALGFPVKTFGAGLPNDDAFFSNIDNTLDQRAVFGEATYRIAGALEVTMGIRYFEIEQDSSSLTGGPLAGGITQTFIRGEEDGVNPKLGLSYKIDEDHLLYLSAAKGFRPGGPLLTATPAGCAPALARLGLSSAPIEYRSDEIWTYDLGSKNQFGGGRIMVNGSLFHTDWSDIQQGVDLGCGYGTTLNAGKARIRGAEIETRFNVKPGLQIGANATLTDTEIVDSGTIFSIIHEGDEILETPRWMASAYGIYAVPLSPSWDLQFRGDYQYRDPQRHQFDTIQAVRFPVNGAYGAVNGSAPYRALFQDAYDVVNFNVSLSNGPTSLRLFVNNAFDAQPSLDTRLSIYVSRTTTLRPRTIGMEVRRKF